MLDTVNTVPRFYKKHKTIEVSQCWKVLYICKINMRSNLVGKELELESSHLAVNIFKFQEFSSLVSHFDSYIYSFNFTGQIAARKKNA